MGEEFLLQTHPICPSINRHSLHLSIIHHSIIHRFCQPIMHAFWLPFAFSIFFSKNTQNGSFRDATPSRLRLPTTVFILQLLATKFNSLLSTILTELRRTNDWWYTSAYGFSLKKNYSKSQSLPISVVNPTGSTDSGLFGLLLLYCPKILVPRKTASFNSFTQMIYFADHFHEYVRNQFKFDYFRCWNRTFSKKNFCNRKGRIVIFRRYKVI